MQHLTLAVFPSSLATSISLPLEILNGANEQARIQNRKHPKLHIEVVSDQTGPVKTAGGLSLIATSTPQVLEQTDLLILPSLWRNPVSVVNKYASFIPWLKRLAHQGTRICAVGTSSFFLAEAGLLDGQAATTHWFFCDQFAKRYPQVDLKRQYLITQSDNLYCAASVNSIADLMVHLVKLYYGQTLARQVEAQFSPEIRRPFEEHAYADIDSSPHHDETVLEAQEWIRAHYAQTINIASLARQLGLSTRSFNRRFKQAVGMPASEYLRNQRLHNARELLRTSNLSISEIAAQTGYQDSSYFCARFREAMGQTPMTYRNAARGKFFHLVDENS